MGNILNLKVVEEKKEEEVKEPSNQQTLL